MSYNCLCTLTWNKKYFNIKKMTHFRFKTRLQCCWSNLYVKKDLSDITIFIKKLVCCDIPSLTTRIPRFPKNRLLCIVLTSAALLHTLLDNTSETNLSALNLLISIFPHNDSFSQKYSRHVATRAHYSERARLECQDSMVYSSKLLGSNSATRKSGAASGRAM